MLNIAKQTKAFRAHYGTERKIYLHKWKKNVTLQREKHITEKRRIS